MRTVRAEHRVAGAGRTRCRRPYAEPSALRAERAVVRCRSYIVHCVRRQRQRGGTNGPLRPVNGAASRLARLAAISHSRAALSAPPGLGSPRRGAVGPASSAGARAMLYLGLNGLASTPGISRVFPPDFRADGFAFAVRPARLVALRSSHPLSSLPLLTHSGTQIPRSGPSLPRKAEERDRPRATATPRFE